MKERGKEGMRKTDCKKKKDKWERKKYRRGKR